MGFSAAAAVVGAVVASSMTQAPSMPAPQAPAPAPQAQAAQTPSGASFKGAAGGVGQAGGSPGIAQTMLTGADGIDPSKLKLGKNTLLGG